MQCVTATFPSWGVTFDVNFLNWLKLSFINLPFALRLFQHNRCGTVQKPSRLLFSRCQHAAASGHAPEEFLQDPRQDAGQLLDHPRCRLATKPTSYITTSVQTTPVWSETQGSTLMEIVPDNLDRNVYRVLLELLYNGLPWKRLPVIRPSWDFVLLAFITINSPRTSASFPLC